MKTFAVALLYALGFVALITAQNSGGWMPIDPTNNDTVALAKYAVDQVNQMDASSCYLGYDYMRTLKAYRQIVAGYNYAFEVEVNTSMKGLCHVHYTEGFEILKNLIVYQGFAGDQKEMTHPENKETLVFEKEAGEEGASCSSVGDNGCKADLICLGNETAVCKPRIAKGEDCQTNEISYIDDECAIGFYCLPNGDRMNCLPAQ